MATRQLVGMVFLTAALGLVAAAASAAAPDARPEAAPEAGARLNPITVEGENFRGDLTIWTLVIFLVVLAILWRFAWGPISQGLAKREQEIASQIAQTQQNLDQAKQLLAQYEQKLADAKDEVRGIVEQGRRDAEQLGRRMIDQAKEEAAGERKRALVEIQAATDAALRELAERSVTLAVELAGKILRTRLAPQDHARLLEEAVAKFAGESNGKK
jgi:F-type H+-transporting ATPase subunit b